MVRIISDCLSSTQRLFKDPQVLEFVFILCDGSESQQDSIAVHYDEAWPQQDNQYDVVCGCVLV
jgi:hypothetical protein